MSQYLDEEVVALQFDNAHFEKNANQSINTLDRLKSSLNFDNNAKGLDEVAEAGKKLNFDGANKSVGLLHSKFSALEIAGVTALANISNKATNMAENLIKSMTGINMITSGWTKFQNMTRNVGTLVGQGFDQDKVYKQLEKLNWYTDETSYDITSMVENIGKFTATGRDLDECVTAMIGIANWTAKSGQNASVATRAMYQLSQALSAGYMRLEDYKSIQNLSMDTEEFRQVALDTAVALGTLKKVGDDTYKSLMTGDAEEFTIAQFANHLTKDAWFTSDVMMDVYKKYSKSVDQIYEYTLDHADSTTSEAIEALTGTVDEFSLKAFEAGQEARTLSDAIDSVKDAASTAWSNTFQLIFGEYTEAKSVWTNLANDLYDIFVTGGNVRNTWLGKLMDKEYTKASDILKQILDPAEKVKQAFEKLTDPISKSLKAFEDLDTIVSKVIEGSFGNGIERYNKLFVEGYNYYKVQNKVNETLHDSFRYTNDIIEAEDKRLGSISTTSDVTAELAVGNKELIKSLKDLTDEEMKSQGYTDAQIQAIQELRDEASKLGMSFDDLIDNAENMNGRWFLLDSFQNIIEVIKQLVDTARKAWNDVFPDDRRVEFLYSLITGFHKFTEQLKLSEEDADSLGDVLRGVFTIIRIGIEFIGKILSLINPLMTVLKPVKSVVLDIFGALGRVLTIIGKLADEVDLVTLAAKDSISSLKTAFKGTKLGTKLTNLTTSLKDIRTLLKGMFQTLTGGIDGEINMEWVDKLSSNVSEKAVSAFKSLGDTIETCKNKLSEFFKAVKDSKPMDAFLEGLREIAKVAEKAWDKIEGFAKSLDFSKINFKANNGIGSQLLDIMESAVAGGLLGALIDMAKTLKQLDKLTVHGAFVGVLDGLRGALKGYQNELNAKALERIGVAVILITVALIGLSTIDERKLENATASLVAMGAILIGFLSVLSMFEEAAARKLNAKMFEDAANNVTEGIKNATEKLAGIPGRFIDVLSNFGKDLGTAVKRIATGVVLVDMAIAIGVITAALIALAKQIEQSPEAMETASYYMAGLLASIEIFTITLSRIKTADIAKVGTVLIAFATALGLMVTAMVTLSKAMVDDEGNDVSERLLWAAGIVAVFFGGVVTMVGILAKAENVTVKMEGMAAMFIGMSVAVLILAEALKAFVKLADSENFDKGLTGMITILSVVGIIGMLLGGIEFGPFKIGCKSLKGVGIAFIEMSASMLLFAKAVEKFGSFNDTVMTKGVIAIGLLMAAVAAVSNYSNGGNAMLLGGSMILLAAGMTALIAPITIIGSLPLATIAKGVGAILVTFAGFAVIGAILAPAAISIKNFGIGLLAFGVGLNLIVTAMTAASVGIGALALAVAAATPAIMLALKGIIAGFTELIPLMVTQFMAIVVGVLEGIDRRIDTITSLVIDIVIKVLDALIPRAGELTGKFLEFVCGVINALADKVPDIGGAVLNLVEAIFGWVFEAIGMIIGDIGEGMSGGFPVIGENMSKFMGNAQGFFDGIKALDNSTLTGAKMLVDIVAALAGDVILNAITSLLTLGLGYKSLGEQLCAFAPYLVDFGQIVSALDESQLSKMSIAARAAKILAEMAQNVPMFNSKIGTFGDQLEPLALDIVKFSQAAAGINETSIDIGVSAAKKLIEMANLVPKSGGLWDWLTGNNDMDQFGAQLEKLGSAIVAFNGTFSGEDLDLSGLDTGIAATEKVIAMANEIPTTGGLQSLLDDKTMNTFGFNLEQLGASIVAFSENVAKISEDDLTNAKSTLAAVGDMMVDMSGVNYDQIASFGEALEDAAKKGINRFINAFVDKYDSVENLGKTFMSKLIYGLKDSSKLATMEQYAKSLNSKTATAFRSGTNPEDAGKNFGQGLINGINSKEWDVYWAGYNLGQKAYQGEMDGQKSHSPSKLSEKAGDYFGQGYIIGLDKAGDDVYKAGYRLGETSVAALRDPLNNIRTALQNELDADPVIRPVLDLSDIKSQSSYLSSMLSGGTINAGVAGSVVRGAGFRNRDTSSDILSAIQRLGNNDGVGNTYQINGITYNDDNAVAEAILTIVRAANVERRA